MKDNKNNIGELPTTRIPILSLIIIIIFVIIFLIVLDNISLPISTTNALYNNSKTLLDYIIKNIFIAK